MAPIAYVVVLPSGQCIRFTQRARARGYLMILKSTQGIDARIEPVFA